jgi:hypothetical protein
LKSFNKNEVAGMAKVAMFCCVILRWTGTLQDTHMQTMNISLPDQLKEFVDEQVGSGRDRV